ncbi:MAG: NAD(P)H-binding protein [Actinomycetota bacterium]|nr:NAD(P)H-binding protein [Actinomycetota bacterium]
MPNPVLVTGGTGTLGRLVVARLRDAGQPVRVLSRHPGSDHTSDGDLTHVTGDLLKETGIEEAVAGVSTVLHLAGGPKGDDVATRHLAQAAARAGVSHLVLISIIGADRLPLGFYRAKVTAEREVMESGVPFTRLRAAQFHDFVLTLAQRVSASPVLAVPTGVRAQPVDADDVAARLVELALGPPAGIVPDLPGPTVYPLTDLVRSYLAAAGKRRLVLPLRLPGAIGRAYRAGDNLSCDTPTGTRTWEEFLAERVRA